MTNKRLGSTMVTTKKRLIAAIIFVVVALVLYLDRALMKVFFGSSSGSSDSLTTTTTSTTTGRSTTKGPSTIRDKRNVAVMSEPRFSEQVQRAVKRDLKLNPRGCRGKERILSIIHAAAESSASDFKDCEGQHLSKRQSNLLEMYEKQYNRKPPLIYGLTTCELSDVCSSLPTWNEVQELYGKTPTVLGMERCPDYRKRLRAASTGGNQTTTAQPRVRVAGLYNSGTNNLAVALSKNLRVDEDTSTPKNTAAAAATEFEVPWGKHVPVKHMLYNNNNTSSTGASSSSSSSSLSSLYQHSNILPVVVVRDPYRWMSSMCKTPYDAKWQRTPDHCPNLMVQDNKPLAFSKSSSSSSSYPVTVQAPQKRQDEQQQEQLTFTDEYDSLAHMWVEWYQQYLDADFPRLVVRFEDTIFHADQVMDQIRACVLGPSAVVATKRSKSAAATQEQEAYYQYILGESKLHGRSSNLVSFLMKYGASEGRTEGMLPQDVKYANMVLQPLMKRFGYQSPIRKQGFRLRRKRSSSSKRKSKKKKKKFVRPSSSSTSLLQKQLSKSRLLVKEGQ